MLALILSVLLSLPTITVLRDGERFGIIHDKGAVWACTVYELQESDPPYVPRHCWGLDEDSRVYYDDWDYILRYDGDWLVWAEIGYPKGGKIEYVETNKVKVHR